MNKNWKDMGWAVVVLALALVLVMALIGSSCIPGAPQEEVKVVKVGMRAVFTGPIASTGVPVNYGNIDYMKYVNERGGINGVPLKLIWEDQGCNVPKAITAHKRLKEAGVVVEIDICSATTETLAPLQVKDQIPHLYLPAYTPGMLTRPTPWVFFGVGGRC